VRDESLLEEMRAAVRGDRQRAEKRRATHRPSQQSAEPEEPEVEASPVWTAEPEQKSGWYRRVTRRLRST